MDLAELPDAVVQPQRDPRGLQQAQKIHDDIHHGQLHIHAHAHAHDSHTTVAVGTYLHRGGKSVYLHGEDHLRQIANTFDSPAQALLAFEKVHAAEMRPGPAPLSDTEREAIAARSVFDITTAKSAPRPAKPETVPIYLADAGDHDALLDTFLGAHGEFEKWRNAPGPTTPPTRSTNHRPCASSASTKPTPVKPPGPWPRTRRPSPTGCGASP